MSYEIIYDKQFIKTKDNKFIPMTYMGSNNCTEMHGNRERRVRDWSPLINAMPILTREELLTYWKDYMDGHMEDYSVGKENILWGMGIRIGGKSTYNDMLNFLNTSMDKAISFDQLKEMDYKLHIQAYHDWKNKSLVVNGIEPINVYTNDEDEFMRVWEDAKKLPMRYIGANWGDNFGKYARQKYFPRARKNQNKELVTVDEYYTIKVDSDRIGYGVYLGKHTARGMNYYGAPYLKYPTKAKAQSLVNKFNKKYPSRTYTVEKVNRPARLYA